MNLLSTIRFLVMLVRGTARNGTIARSLALSLAVALPAPLLAQAVKPTPVVLDSVVAEVNDQAILASDVENELRLSVLDAAIGSEVLTRKRALDQLVSRALIQQQIRQEDEQAAVPSQSEVDNRLAEIRKELPACVRQSCATDAGWKAFLEAHGLTQGRVESYLRYRLEILSFIERRFRQGIQVPQKDIETYYHDTLLPQYQTGESIPTLDKVAPRIEEILLQQRVNALFDDWLENLRKQGDIEVVDPAYQAADPRTEPSGGKGEGLE